MCISHFFSSWNNIPKSLVRLLQAGKETTIFQGDNDVTLTRFTISWHSKVVGPSCLGIFRT